MADDASSNRFEYTSLGSAALVGGVVCCLGVKLLGGVALLAGLGAVLGVSTGLLYFLIGGIVGLAFAVLVFALRRGSLDLSISSG